MTLPDAPYIRSLIADRRARAHFFKSDLFADPAWDILLDLAAAYVEGQRVCITSLCIASDVPDATAMRWIQRMVDDGLLVREPDDEDRRRTWVSLSDPALLSMAEYFARIADRPALRVAA